MNIRTAVICAAGLGSRLGLDTPKCLVKIGKHRLIYYLLKALEEVPNIRIVVGFKEEEVIEAVRVIRPDALFVRNPEFRTTTNAYSLHLGSRDLQEPFLNIDGDMYIEPAELKRFDSKIKHGENLIGITNAYTEDAVYVQVDTNGLATGFSRDPISSFEWTGIAFFGTIPIRKEGRYVFEELESHLPIPTCHITCFEIDTPKDLEFVYGKIDPTA